MRGKPKTDHRADHRPQGREQAHRRHAGAEVIRSRASSRSSSSRASATCGWCSSRSRRRRPSSSTWTAGQAGRDEGLVLDLRNDPGGLLHGAVGVSAAFLPPKALVVSTDGRADDSKPQVSGDTRRLPARFPRRLHPQRAGLHQDGADGGAGEWRFGVGLRDRRRRLQDPSARW